MDQWTSGADYDQWMGRWSRLVAQEFLKWLELPSGLRWVDVCCGSGVITEAILERNAPATVVGVDASAAQISFARSVAPTPTSSSRPRTRWPCRSRIPVSMLWCAASD